jgi:hypothetical protein
MPGVTPTHHQDSGTPSLLAHIVVTHARCPPNQETGFSTNPVVTPGDILTHREPYTDHNKSLGVTPGDTLTPPGFTRYA